MAKKIIASSLDRQEQITAIVDSVDVYLKGLNRKPLLMYLFDIAPAEALPFLAEQLNVLGYKGWLLARTEQDQRELLKKAIELKRYKGTPWSVKEAIKAVGFGGAEIIEGVATADRSGLYAYNGAITHNGAQYHWALFSVVIDLGNDRGLTPEQSDLVLRMIREYKPARSTLVGVNYKLNMSTIADINDDALTYGRELSPDTDVMNGVLHNGTATRNGAQRYRGTSEDNARLVIRNAQGNITQTTDF